MNRAVKGVMRMAGILLAAECLTGAVTAGAATSEWAVATDGVWTNPACWVDGQIPTNTSTSTNDVSINVSGVYTSQWMNNIQRVSVGAIDVGTAAGSGQETLKVSGYAYQQAGIYGPITVGSHGVFDQRMPLVGISTGQTAGAIVNVQSGGVFRSIGLDSGGNSMNLGNNRIFVVDAGGRIEITDGFLSGVSLNSPYVCTNNGTILGAGKFTAMAGSAGLAMTGSGTLDGPGLLYLPSNGFLTLGGTLVINRSLAFQDLGPLYFMDGADITMNGNVTQSNAVRRYCVSVTNASNTVRGSGSFDYTFVSPTASSFGGRDNTSTGTNTLAGTGTLMIRTSGNTVDMFFSLFILSRTGTVSDAGGGIPDRLRAQYGGQRSRRVFQNGTGDDTSRGS